jgi:putative transcriptional regulator
MPIIVNLDVMLAQRKMKPKNLAARIGITEATLSLLKQRRVRGVRFETLAAICVALRCQPATYPNSAPGTRTTSIEPATRHACRACSPARMAP